MLEHSCQSRERCSNGVVLLTVDEPEKRALTLPPRQILSPNHRFHNTSQASGCLCEPWNLTSALQRYPIGSLSRHGREQRSQAKDCRIFRTIWLVTFETPGRIPIVHLSASR